MRPERLFPSRWPRPPAARNYSAAFPGQREAKLGFVGDLMGQKENAGEPASTVRNTRQALVGVTVVLMKDGAVQRAWGCLRDLGAHLEVRPILPRGCLSSREDGQLLLQKPERQPPDCRYKLTAHPPCGLGRESSPPPGPGAGQLQVRAAL